MCPDPRDGDRAGHDQVGGAVAGPPLDWDAAGRAFGVPTARPDDCAELTELTHGGADRRNPLLVHVPVTGAVRP
jgi:thiamine pyrophosphate-dependent acetolactate synthase large subunit-like protein